MKRVVVLIALLLVVSSLGVSQKLWTNSGSSNAATKKCARLTRAGIEKEFGHPNKCTKGSEDFECFGSAGEPIRVQFNSSDVVTSMVMSTGNGLHNLTKVLNEILPRNARGKYLEESKKSPSGSCQVGSQEQYECVTLNYFQELCMNSAPASIQVVWK